MELGGLSVIKKFASMFNMAYLYDRVFFSYLLLLECIIDGNCVNQLFYDMCNVLL
jgi:hypothetical protein